MDVRWKNLARLLAGLFLLVSMQTLAGPDSELGYGSATTDYGISLNLEPKVKIWGLEDFYLSNAVTSLTKPICLFSNSDVGFNAHVVTENQFKLVNGSNTGASYRLILYMKPGKNTEEVGGVWGYTGSNLPFYGVGSVGLSPEMSCDSTTSNVDLTIDLYQISNQEGVYSDQVTITISPL